MSSPSNTFYAALTDYVIQTGVDPTEHPFSEKLEACRSANAVLELLQDKAEQFKEYRDGNIKLIDFLSPIVQTLYVLSGVLHEAAMDYEDGFVSPSSMTPPDNILYPPPVAVPISAINLCLHRCSPRRDYLPLFL